MCRKEGGGRELLVLGGQGLILWRMFALERAVFPLLMALFMLVAVYQTVGGLAER